MLFIENWVLQFYMRFSILRWFFIHFVPCLLQISSASFFHLVYLYLVLLHPPTILHTHWFVYACVVFYLAHHCWFLWNPFFSHNLLVFHNSYQPILIMHHSTYSSFVSNLCTFSISSIHLHLLSGITLHTKVSYSQLFTWKQKPFVVNRSNSFLNFFHPVLTWATTLLLLLYRYHMCN